MSFLTKLLWGVSLYSPHVPLKKLFHKNEKKIGETPLDFLTHSTQGIP
jgi:hypothetical protein